MKPGHTPRGPHLLLTCAGRRVGLLQALQRELRRRVPEGRVFAADVRPAGSAACALADGAVALPPLADAGYAAALARACATHGIGVVVPTVDSELAALATQRQALAAAGTAAVVCDAALVAHCADKHDTAALFAAHGMAVPEIYAAAPERFPAFVKPRRGSCSVGAQVVASHAAWQVARAADPSLLTMRYLAPADYDEYTVDCYYGRDATLREAVPRLRLRVRGGEVQDAVTRRNALLPWLRAHLGTLAGARGPLTVQCFVARTGDEMLASEINPRFAGGFPLSYAAGANYPGWIVDEYLLQRAPRRPRAWQADVTMLRYDAHVLRRPPAA